MQTDKIGVGAALLSEALFDSLIRKQPTGLCGFMALTLAVASSRDIAPTAIHDVPPVWFFLAAPYGVAWEVKSIAVSAKTIGAASGSEASSSFVAALPLPFAAQGQQPQHAIKISNTTKPPPAAPPMIIAGDMSRVSLSREELSTPAAESCSTVYPPLYSSDTPNPRERRSTADLFCKSNP